MPLETIRINQYPQADRMEVQQHIAASVAANPEQYIEQYRNDPRSFGGRYVCSDLFKESFAEYNTSRESRDRYNAPVHNSAAVLASEQFRRVIADNSAPQRDRAIFLTGIPGAGKTTQVLVSSTLPPDARVVFEGQLSNPATTIPKLQEAMDAGLRPEIVVVHTAPERALQNTLTRFEQVGRGASLHVMAQIQAGLPEGLKAVRDHFGDAIELVILDRRSKITKEVRGWDHLPELASEGSYEHIKQRLQYALDQHRDAGTISDTAYQQAVGTPTSQFVRSVDTERRGSLQRPDQPISQGLLVPSSELPPKVEHYGSLRFWQEVTPSHTIKYAAGRLAAPGTQDAKRQLAAQRAVSRGTGDDAGHLIGHQFGGPEIPGNLSLQHHVQNQGGGTYWQLESQWAELLKNGVGVDVSVREMTRAGEDRPYHRHVAWVETHPTGKTEHSSIDFMNAESQRGRAAKGQPVTRYEQPAEVVEFYPHSLARDAIAVRLTEEHVKLLLSSDYPDNSQQQTTALYNIFSGKENVETLGGRVGLDYSDEQGTFFGILRSDDKPLLDKRLTELQTERQPNRIPDRSRDRERD
jgi:DNA/RNA non-specific endonuclease/Zeta toxin